MQTTLINGTRVEIRQNLWDFLVILRNQNRSRTLLADLVCINQIDLVEKGQQVQMMGRTFQSAQRVLVWLGKAADDSDQIFDEARDPEDCQ